MLGFSSSHPIDYLIDAVLAGLQDYRRCEVEAPLGGHEHALKFGVDGRGRLRLFSGLVFFERVQMSLGLR
jgi:hypothetical protein